MIEESQSISIMESERGNPLIDALADWLVNQALRDKPIEDIMEYTCKQLYAAGIPLFRAHVTFAVLHPLFSAQSVSWNRGAGEISHSNFLTGRTTDAWRRSPFYFMIANQLPYLRRRLTGEGAILDFPVLEELAEKGITDYLAFMIQFNEELANIEETDGLVHGSGIVGSWATDRPIGFTNSDIRSLRRIEQRLAVAFKVTIQSRITDNILSAYLGPGAGRKVIDGQISRGDVDTINSVVWFSDMRESTSLAESLSGPEFMDVLNTYFECTAGAVQENGGEVLRFIGDAVLAIFPIYRKNQVRKRCEIALKTARLAQSKMEEANRIREEQGKSKIDFGLGLHIGELLFGNIGTPERLEFSVIGPVANQVARLESMTKSLGQQVLVSEDFARNLDQKWKSMGKHELRGVGQSMEIFAPVN